MTCAETLANRNVFCSWSGGKDSCLALWNAVQAGARPRLLLTMMVETGQRSRSHGLSLDILSLQSAALGIPLATRSASWDSYEKVFTLALEGIRSEGIDTGVFGDIDIEDHRRWVERVCSTQGVGAILPLWGRDHRNLVEEFLDAGFEAVIISVKEEKLDKEFLGMQLSGEILDRFAQVGVDASGEGGEYHTVVTNGPLFSRRVNLSTKGSVLRDGYWFLDVAGSL